MEDGKMDIITKLEQQYEIAMKLADRRDEENEELETQMELLKQRLADLEKYGPGDNDEARRERLKAQVQSELTRLQGLELNNPYKFDPTKLKVHVLPPRSKELEKDETVEFRLMHPDVIDFTLVGIQEQGCDTQIYQQLQYPNFNEIESTEEFNTNLNNTVFQTPVIPFENKRLSVYEYKQMLDDKIREGNSTCGSMETPEMREQKCTDAQTEVTGNAKYKYFSVPQMMLPLYFNPHTLTLPMDYPSLLLYQGVGAGKTCTGLKLFNNFRCQPYKKIWVTNPNLEAQLLSGAIGKADINSCWDDLDNSGGERKVFVGKEYVEKHELGIDQILVLTYSKFAEIFYRGSSKEGRLYRKAFPSFWTRPNESEPLDPKTYRYNIFDPLTDARGHPIIKNGQKVQGPRAGKRTKDWEQLNDFDPLENAIIIVDEAHQLETVQGPQIRVVKNAIKDSQQNPNGKGVKLVLMTATPITDDPMTAIKLFNFLIPQKYERLPEDKDKFINEFWKDEPSRLKFINRIKGIVSYYDPSTNITGFAQAIPGEILIPKEEQEHLQYEKSGKYGIIKIAFNENETQGIIKSCNVQPLNFAELKEISNPIDLLKKIPKLTFEKLCLMYGVSMNRSSNPELFIDEVFNKDFKRDNKEIVIMIINKLRAMVYECINDLAVTGEPPTRYDKGKGGKDQRIKEFKSDYVKVKILTKQMKSIDDHDMATEGHLNKQMIYSSGRLFKTKNMNEWPTVPVRLLSALVHQKNMQFNVFTSIKEMYEKILAPANLTLERKSNGNLLLCKKDKNAPVILSRNTNNLYFMRNPGNKAQRETEEATKEVFEAIFNDHMYNNEGQLIRFILLDTGFKEGISLFNIKHVHIMEPQASSGDMTQAVGRAIRFCGHKGTKYEYKVGWKVSVYLYDTWIMDKNEPGGGYTIGNKILNILGEQTDFKDQLDTVIKTSAFDYTLNLPADSDELRAPIDKQATLLGSLWQRPPESFDYGQFEKKYFYKMFPKVRAIPEDEVVNVIIKPLLDAANSGKYFWQKYGYDESAEIEKTFVNWIVEKYYEPFLKHDEELMNDFNSTFASRHREMPSELRLLFRDFNYQKDIVLQTNGGKQVMFPVFAFKERSKIDFERSPDLNEIRAMIIYNHENGNLTLLFRDISNSAICDVQTTIKDDDQEDKLYNLSLWLRIPSEKINFTKDISHFVGNCRGRAPGIPIEDVSEDVPEIPHLEVENNIEPKEDTEEKEDSEDTKEAEERGWLGKLWERISGKPKQHDENEQDNEELDVVDYDRGDVEVVEVDDVGEVGEQPNKDEEIHDFEPESDVVEDVIDVEQNNFDQNDPISNPPIRPPLIHSSSSSSEVEDSEDTEPNFTLKTKRFKNSTTNNNDNNAPRRSERLRKIIK